MTYGALPEVEPFLYGIKPAVIAVILGATWKLGRKAVKGWRFAVIGLAVIVAVLVGLGEIWALFLGGLPWGRCGFALRDTTHARTANSFLPILFLRQATGGTGGRCHCRRGRGPCERLALEAVLPVLQGRRDSLRLRLRAGGLPRSRTRAGPTAGSARNNCSTPSPSASSRPGRCCQTATFIGFVIEGVPGALVATLGIFLPSFFFVLMLNPLIPKLRESAWMSAFLDAVNVAAVALMIAVTIDLGRATLVSWPAWLIALSAAVLALRFKVNAAWLVLGGAVAGWLLSAWA